MTATKETKRKRKPTSGKAKPARKKAAATDRNVITRARDRDRVVELVFGEGLSVAQAAKRVGIHKVTAYRYLADPEAKEKREVWMAEIRERARVGLSLHVDQAVTTLGNVARTGTKEHGARVKAAEAILDRTGVTVAKEPVKLEVTGGLDVGLVAASNEELLAIAEGRKPK